MRGAWLGLLAGLRLFAQTGAPDPSVHDHAGSILIQACWAGAPGGKVHLVAKPTNQPFPLQAQPGAIVANTAVPPCEGFELWVANDPKARRVATFTFPKTGRRFILLMQGEHPSSMQAWLIPADLESFPWGSACLLNLSDRRLRCRINGKETEVDPGRSGVVPFTANERVSAHLDLDYREGGKWLPDCSTKTILSPSKRFIMVVGPGLASQGPLPKETVVETDPAPVKATTTPQDQPTK